MTNAINIRTAVIFWLVTLGYMSAIFYLSSLTFGGLPELPENSDKLVHTAIYIPLAFLFYLALKKSGVKRYLFITAFLMAGIYGITDEIHQYFVPGRDAAAGDVIADFVGAAAGCFGASLFRS